MRLSEHPDFAAFLTLAATDSGLPEAFVEKDCLLLSHWRQGSESFCSIAGAQKHDLRVSCVVKIHLHLFEQVNDQLMSQGTAFGVYLVPGCGGNQVESLHEPGSDRLDLGFCEVI